MILHFLLGSSTFFVDQIKLIPIRYQSTPSPPPPRNGEGSTDDVSPFPFREGAGGLGEFESDLV